MDLSEIKDIVAEVKCFDYTIEAKQSMATAAWYMVGFYAEADTVTGAKELQTTRRWLLTPHMTKSEIVSTAFALVMLSMEHRTREWFLYRGRAIYMPHYNVDDLHAISEERETRNA